MADKQSPSESVGVDGNGADSQPGNEQDRERGGTATVKPKRARKKAPARKPTEPLPPWKVLLHNDDKNEMLFVVTTIVSLTPLNQQDAANRTLEAHESGVSLLLTTHRERAELYEEQFQSKGLVVSIEPAE